MKSIINKAMPEFDIDIDIDVKDPKWLDLISDIETHTNKIVQDILKQLLPDAQHIEISIVLADNDFVQELNKNYRKKDKPTNVLSFPQTEDNEMSFPVLMLGDIIIASGIIEQEASEQNKTIKNHFTHMLVHSCLHLLHYDHITDEEAEIMESMEIKILNDLGIKNPYAL